MTAIVPGDFRVVSNFEPTSLTIKGGETISDRKGKFLRVDGTTGKAMLANASSAAEAGGLHGFALSNQRVVGDSVSLFRHGLLDWGDALDALDFGDSVYLADTDSAYADSAGTVTVEVGKVWPVFESDGSIKRLLYVDLR